jgi:hypothetical protein
MKRPSWPTIILGFLNIIAAGFLMSLATKDFYARAGWSQHILDGYRVRDGLLRTSEFDDQDETDKIVEGLSEEGKKQVREYLAEYKRRHEELKEKGLVKGKDGTPSKYVMRRQAEEIGFDPVRDKGSKLRVGEQEVDQMMKNLGPKDLQRLMQNHYMLRHPQLRAEEQQVAEQKATMLALRETYNKQIALLELEIARLNERLTAEKAVTTLQEQENEERRKELSNLYAELEEALAARGLAEGRLKDLQDHLARTKRRFAELSKETDQLEDRIRKTEGVGGR